MPTLVVLFLFHKQRHQPPAHTSRPIDNEVSRARVPGLPAALWRLPVHSGPIPIQVGPRIGIAYVHGDGKFAGPANFQRGRSRLSVKCGRADGSGIATRLDGQYWTPMTLCAARRGRDLYLVNLTSTLRGGETSPVEEQDSLFECKLTARGAWNCDLEHQNRKVVGMKSG